MIVERELQDCLFTILNNNLAIGNVKKSNKLATNTSGQNKVFNKEMSN